ncbi:MAG TPA: squalene--hopene cyclase [Dongiaceae bacterium]|jgi:squalene-hopene/tetraprenyl-beta-curcumene cyclase
MNKPESLTLPEVPASALRARLEGSIGRATSTLLGLQRPDGHWVFELEADATIPAEYVLLKHFLGEPAPAEVEAKIAVYLRRIQGEHGGWPLFHEGAFNISASVKAYIALKTIGDPIDAPHMRRARAAILAHGGAATSNVFTRCLLALFGAIPWRGVPVMPVEIMHLPAWFPFHLSKVSYWARTVLVPLLVLMTLKPRARNPRGIEIRELFIVPPEQVRRWPKGPHQVQPWTTIFGVLDAILHVVEPWFPKRQRKRAIDKAAAFTIERLNGEDGLGAIFPAMANSVMMFDVLGYPLSDPNVKLARASIEKLLVVKDDEIYCQPCLSPVWDTSLVCHALLEVGTPEAVKRCVDGLNWLKPLQVLDVVGDWADQRPDVRPGGWAFQYVNPHYPDVDDTAVVVMAMDRAAAHPDVAGKADFKEAIARGQEWVVGVQSRNGGWGAFDADNTHYYLNNIPFADHGALLDPPTADVSGRCLGMLAQLGDKAQKPALDAGVDYLLKTQEKDGSWYGRWGMNYIYGTWSVLAGLNAAGVDHQAPSMRKAVEWLAAIQNADGGWGEDGDSYKLAYKGYEAAPSTASQTAWAVLALMAAGEVKHPSVARGIDYLLTQQGDDGVWNEDRFTATGFPRVFYLRYHGYAKFFPLWALARYRNLTGGNTVAVLPGL